jgi:hypothetical protein
MCTSSTDRPFQSAGCPSPRSSFLSTITRIASRFWRTKFVRCSIVGCLPDSGRSSIAAPGMGNTTLLTLKCDVDARVLGGEHMEIVQYRFALVQLALFYCGTSIGKRCASSLIRAATGRDSSTNAVRAVVFGIAQTGERDMLNVHRCCTNSLRPTETHSSNGVVSRSLSGWRPGFPMRS